ncbi:MAG: DUF3179 domain-containing protein [Armatimonadetes bacterium]|nr:DUF3179 domain-containing protein [Armatimonadota bacterium]
MSRKKSEVKPIVALAGGLMAVALGYGIYQFVNSRGMISEVSFLGGDDAQEPPPTLVYEFDTPMPDGAEQRANRGGVPAVLEPVFVAADDSNLPEAAYVVGVAYGGEARAYSINLLDRHLVVNDTVGGRNIIVTCSPLRGATIVFSREVDGEDLDFLSTGVLYRNGSLMYDTKTESFWSQYTGEALAGPMKGKWLTMLPSASRVRFGDWLREHPGTDVLRTGRQTHVTRSDYFQYYERAASGEQPVREDDRLPGKDVVLGFYVNGTAMAYPMRVVRDESPLNVEIGGRRLVVCAEPSRDFICAFERPPGTQFAALDGHELVAEDGSKYNVITGRGQGGETLIAVTVIRTFWFAWADLYPDTGLYMPVETESGAPSGEAVEAAPG